MKRKVAQCAFRLLRGTTNFRSGDLAGHLGIPRNFPKITMLISMTDCMQRMFFDHSFEKWVGEGSLFEDNFYLRFTDGSRKGGKVSVGVRGPDFGLTEPLGAYPTVFQSEVHAIELCARENWSRKLIGELTYIHLDSQAALKALRACTFKSKLVWNCLLCLEDLAH